MFFVLQCIYFMLPAYFANMAPVFAQKVKFLKFLALPVDGGRTFKEKPILGANKTWRGLIVGIIIAIFTVWFQKLLYTVTFFNRLSFIDYSEMHWCYLGFLFGFGALFGDLVKSFFKRRINLKPGAPWIPFDQVDFVIGALIFVSFAVRLPWSVVLVVLLISPILHILTNQIGFILKIKNTKW